MARALESAGSVLAISKFTSGLLCSLPEPVGSRVVRPSLSPEAESLCRRPIAPFSPAAPSLVTVARLVERKGIQHTIEALGILRRAGISLRLSIIGEGVYLDALRRQASSEGLEGCVTFHGGLSDEDAAKVVGAASIFVLTPFEDEPGSVEGYGLAYLEAGALGKPVIGTRTGGVPEAVRENETGLLVDAGAPPKVAEAIVRLVQNEGERRRLGEAGRRWALAHAPSLAAASLVEALGLDSR